MMASKVWKWMDIAKMANEMARNGFDLLLFF